MSRFLSHRHNELTPYTPGEQPKAAQYIKLNTNESPFPPSKMAIEAASKAAERLQLYPDPECLELRKTIAEQNGVAVENVIVGNGSDEILQFAFMAFCDEKNSAVFPDITYGFYPVFAKLNQVPFEEISLKEDLSINISDYLEIGKTIFIANPNAPTGIILDTSEIELIVSSNPDNIIVIDEAYVDFGAESCIPLTKKYDNLLVVQTFSKSRSMAGARLGFAIGCTELINDLETIRYSTNPYNINSMTMAAGIAVLQDEKYTRKNCAQIVKNRTYAAEELKKLGFCLTDSSANFIFAMHPKFSGEYIYSELKKRGILVRHFAKPKISEYNRITVGSLEQMIALTDALKVILED